MNTSSKIIMVLFLAVLAITPVHFSFAGDELLLTGILKDVDPNNRTVSVDVKSSSCPGLRKFFIENPGRLEPFVGVRVNFAIDSSVCAKDKVYKMDFFGRAK